MEALAKEDETELYGRIVYGMGTSSGISEIGSI